MKKNRIIFPFLLLLICFIITHPNISTTAAADGLLLWYQQLLPALLPLSILSNIMVYSNYMQVVTKYLYPVTKWIFATSPNGTFALLGGIFFGFPMGSKISADLVRNQSISREEGEILSICFNQLSPVFFSSYLLTYVLALPEYTIPSFIILYLPPCIYAFFALRKHSFSKTKKAASVSHIDFGIIDAGIMNGFEALTKLGGYIVLFSIFAAMLYTCNKSFPIINLLSSGCVEVTTGISYLKDAKLPKSIIYGLAIFFASFGGLCGFAQTCSMTKACHFSYAKYFICRIIFGSISGILGVICFPLLERLIRL